jgi:hypothetical protein
MFGHFTKFSPNKYAHLNVYTGENPEYPRLHSTNECCVRAIKQGLANIPPVFKIGWNHLNHRKQSTAPC